MRHTLLFFILALSLQFSYAQGNQGPAVNEKEVITIKKDRFLKKTNWVTVGIGYGQKLNSSDYSFPGSFNCYFHIKQVYLNVGIMRTKLDVLRSRYSPNFLTDIHGTVGFRTESRKNNFSYFAGPSYIQGLLDSTKSYKGIGAYAEIQYIQKIYYDIGIGTSVFVNYNRSFPILGIRLDFYFSNAFRGKRAEESFDR